MVSPLEMTRGAFSLFAVMAGSLALHGLSFGAVESQKSGSAVEFDSMMLMPGMGRQMDLRQFAHGNPILPGVYRVDIYLNQRWLGRMDLKIAQRPPAVVAEPCLDPALVDRLAIDDAALKINKPVEPGAAPPAKPSCYFFSELVDGARADFDPSSQRLDMSIPQAMLKKQVRGAVPIDQMDAGINAGILNYQFNAFHTNNNQANGNGDSTTGYLGLNAGLNLGLWHFRTQGSAQYDKQTGTKYQQIASYISRDLLEIKSNLTIGQTFTDGQLFNSFGVQGVKLSSDERMLPESQRGFAPVIRSEARSNAKVTVSQNGLVIYETVVPPGPFALSDIYPTGFGGDLVVTVTEADGSQRSFNVPYSSMPSLMREGQLRYSLVLGNLRQSLSTRQVLEGTAQYGFSNQLTGNGGFLISNQYVSVLGGVGLNTEAGAFSVNTAVSRLNLPDQGAKHGASVNANWSKLFEPTRTNFSFAAYRYNSENYYTLQDAVSLLDAASHYGQTGGVMLRQRSLILGTVSQNMGRWGTLNFSGSSTNYWGQNHSNSGFQFGYAFNVGRSQVNVNLGREYSMDPSIPTINRVSLGLTMPLDLIAGRPSSLITSVQHDSLHGTTSQAGAFGTFGDRAEGNYAATASRNYGQDRASGTLGYRSSVAQLGVSVSSGSGQSQVGLTASGGLIAHAGGVTLAPSLSETSGLVYVEDGEGIQLAGFQGAPVDGRGYMVVPYLNPYTLNSVELDLSKAPADLQLDSNSRQVAPTAGAVLSLKFVRSLGRTVLIRSALPSGESLPFGASVLDEDGNVVGSVGQFSRLEARVQAPTGSLKIQWGSEPGQSCWLNYTLPPPTPGVLAQLQESCGSAPVSEGRGAVGRKLVSAR